MPITISIIGLATSIGTTIYSGEQQKKIASTQAFEQRRLVNEKAYQDQKDLKDAYNQYISKKDKEYLEWCEKWLYSKFQSLKPGGSLFVMNIPKWAIHHFNFLKKIMLFDKWIVWDALSTPAGKLLPAHYSILHFVKPGKKKILSS